jgi:hypothetical protein
MSDRDDRVREIAFFFGSTKDAPKVRRNVTGQPLNLSTIPIFSNASASKASLRATRRAISRRRVPTP